jgi:hypothetical protein
MILCMPSRGISPSDAKYSERQKLAIVLAHQPGSVPWSRVCEMAAAGELRDDRGRKLPAFSLPEQSARSIAKRLRDRAPDELGAAMLRRAVRALSRKAHKMAADAQTPEDVSRAAKALADVQRLEVRVREAPTPKDGGATAQAILAAARSEDGVYTPEPEPPKREEPKPVEPPSPGDWMRRQVDAHLAQSTSPTPVRRDVGACDDSDIWRDEAGHPAFGLPQGPRPRNRIAGIDYSPAEYFAQRGYGLPRSPA